MTITIENDQLRVAIAEDYGARVVSLFDKQAGREWMTRGGKSPNVDEGAVYQSAEAVAWDECFPTVGTWDATGTPWKRKLRDHGDLWGRPWSVERLSPDAATLSHGATEFRFERGMRLVGAELRIDYAVTNRTDKPLPYLWALHALLSVDAGDTIELPYETVRASFLSSDGQILPAGRDIAWTTRDPALPFVLAEVQPTSANFAAKLIGVGKPNASARVGRPGQRLTITWDDRIADLGIWITYGAWFGHQEIALEPTSAPADDVGQAIAAGAAPLTPGETRHWSITLSTGA